MQGDPPASPQWKSVTIPYEIAPTSAESGIVNIHAMMMLPANPHLTAESLVVAPTPMIAPVMVCVVLTGIPKLAVMSSVIAPAVSAQNPPYGVSFVIF